MAVDISFHHGTRTTEINEDVVSIRTAQSAVISLHGTAPDADEDAFPLNIPVLIKGASNYSLAAKLGEAGTLKKQLDAIFDQGGDKKLGAYVYVVRHAEGANLAETLSNIVGDGPTMTGVHAAFKIEGLYGRNLGPRIFIAPGFTGPLATDGVATTVVTAPGRDYDENDPPAIAIDGDGVGAQGIARIVDGEVDAVIITKPGFGYTHATIAVESTPPTVTRVADQANGGNGLLTLAGTPYSGSVKPGVYVVTCTAAAANGGTFSVLDPDGVALANASVGVAYDGPVKFTIADGADDFEVGDKFRITVAITGGFGATATATVGTVGNPVAHELEGIIAQLKAVAFIDGPNTTDQAAVLAREKYGSERLMIVDPFCQIWDTELDAYVPEPSSARFAGVQCRVDRDQGFVKSVSNELIYGIDGVSRPIVYGNQTDYLNENCVSTIVNFGEGYRTWGNRTTANTFLSVRRTRDFVNAAIEKAYLEFVDKPLNEANLKFLVESAKAFLRTLEAEGYLLKGSDVWLDEALNPPTELRQGRVKLSIKYEVPPPMEDINIVAYQNIQAYTLLLQRVGAAIEGGSLSLAA